jgi:hypothetical protein
MANARTRTAICFFLLMLLGLFMQAPSARPRQQTEEQPTATGQPWEAGTRYPDWEAPSNLTVTNDCKKGHTFSITPENADFIDFKGVKEITVPGKKSIQVPVRFHTDGMTPGEYTGKVTVLCLDCKEVPPCVQDRKLLTPHIVVIPKPETATPTTLQDTPQTPAAPTDCDAVEHNCGELYAQMEIKVAEWEKAEAAYTQALNHAEDLDWSAEIDCQNAQEGSDYLADVAQMAELAGVPAEEYRSLVDEVNQAWSECLESDNDWRVADAQAGDAGRAADAAWAAYQAAEDAFQKCKENRTASCKPRPLVDNPFDGSSFWKPWPVEPTGGSAAPTGGTPKKSAVPKFPPIILPPPKVETPTTQTKPPCPVTSDDCENLRRIWKQKEAEAATAQADADAAMAYAKSVGKTAGDAATASVGQKTGKSVEDAAAAMAIAAGAEENAESLQKAADQAKAAAAAAKQAYDDCVKALAECTRKERAAAAGTAPHTQSKGCAPFPENCDAYKAQYDFLNNAATMAQAQADRAKAQQDLNNKQADGLEKDAATAQNFANWQTSRALEWRNLAGDMAAIASHDLEIRNQYPAGSPNWNSWNDASQADVKESQSRSAYANELEATELKYDMEATRLKTEAAQLRSATSDAQAKADQAKATATAALYAWKDCVAREEKYYEDCQKKAGASGTP